MVCLAHKILDTLHHKDSEGQKCHSQTNSSRRRHVPPVPRHLLPGRQSAQARSVRACRETYRQKIRALPHERSAQTADCANPSVLPEPADATALFCAILPSRPGHNQMPSPKCDGTSHFWAPRYVMFYLFSRDPQGKALRGRDARHAHDVTKVD